MSHCQGTDADEHSQHLVLEAAGRTVFYSDLDQPLAPLLKQAFTAGGLKGQFQADNIVKMPRAQSSTGKASHSDHFSGQVSMATILQDFIFFDEIFNSACVGPPYHLPNR